MEEKDIETFDPTIAELTRMVEETKGITATDLTDKGQLDIVRKNRIALKTARVKIEKTGKSLREGALAYQKKVIAKEKELIGIIEPEEDRLAAIEAEAEALAIRQDREARLPARKERLEKLGVEVTDEFLLTLDATAFETYYNEQVAAKNEADRLKAEADQREKDEKLRKENEAKEAALFEAQKKVEDDRLANEREKERLASEKAAREREEKAREEERQRAEEEAKRKEAERIAAEKKAKEDAEKKEAEEKAALAKREAYRKFREEHGWTEATKGNFKEEKTEREVVLWKKVGTFEL